jgi:hypothetical protein
MKKFSKAITTGLCVLTLTSVLSGTYMEKVNAQSIQPIGQSQNREKITDAKEAIKLIEQNYLTLNPDGTTIINTTASKYIDSKLFKQIETGSQQINKKIKAGDLIFDKSTKELHEKQHAKPSTYIAGTYIWHWYGFDFVMDAYNSNIFAALLTQDAGLLAGGAAIGFLIPGVTVVCSALSATLAYWSGEAWLGNADGRGCIAYFFGDPSWAQLYSVQAN